MIPPPPAEPDEFVLPVSLKHLDVGTEGQIPPPVRRFSHLSRSVCTLVLMQRADGKRRWRVWVCLYLNSPLTRCPLPPPSVLLVQPVWSARRIEPRFQTWSSPSFDQTRSRCSEKEAGREGWSGGFNRLRWNQTDKVTPSFPRPCRRAGVWTCCTSADLRAEGDIRSRGIRRPASAAEQRNVELTPDDERDSARAEQESVSPRKQAVCSSARGGGAGRAPGMFWSLLSPTGRNRRRSCAPTGNLLTESWMRKRPFCSQTAFWSRRWILLALAGARRSNRGTRILDFRNQLPASLSVPPFWIWSFLWRVQRGFDAHGASWRKPAHFRPAVHLACRGTLKGVFSVHPPPPPPRSVLFLVGRPYIHFSLVCARTRTVQPARSDLLWMENGRTQTREPGVFGMRRFFRLWG